MADEFDWDLETLEDGDDESTKTVVDVEPTWNQTGVDVPGELAGQYQAWLRGGFNLDFAKGPPDPTQNISVASSTVASNFLPGWRFIQSSNTNITAKQQRDTTVSAGSNLRFSFASGSANDEAYMETLLPVRGNFDQRAADFAEFYIKASSGTAGRVVIEGQYLTVDGALVGSATRFTQDPTTSYSNIILFAGNNQRMAPATARNLRLRIIAMRDTGTGSFTLDVADGQRYAAQPYGVVLGDFTDPTMSPGIIHQRGGLVWAVGDSFNGGPQSVISVQLMALGFIMLNIPAGAATEMNYSDNALGVARVPVPWSGHIVGISYRMSTAVTGGTLGIRSTINGTNDWTAHSLSSGSPTSDQASTAPGNHPFAAGDDLGIELNASAGYTPTTADIHAVLWLAIEYDGT